MNKKVIVVIGSVCSGKDTFAQTLTNHIQIDIGSIVREIKKEERRVYDQSLDNEIIRRFDNIIERDLYGHYVITGIRQLSIVHWIMDNIKEQHLELIYLDVPREELKRRFINRESDKDKGLSFEEVIERDSKLGLGRIEEFVKNYPDLFTIIKNY